MKNLISAVLAALLLITSSVGIEENICTTVDIRHSKNLHLLNNCTVIDGNLILAFPYAFDDEPSKSVIESTSFPLLREVTGFVLLYIIGYVKSLGKLLPNLTIIRGSRLFEHYALVISDCDHLEEITLRNLLKISRGSVKIAGDHGKLCFPRKIDFDQIVMNGQVFLPNDFNRSICKIDDNKCDDCMPKGNCWHNGACQRFKSSYFVRNIRTGEACHELCLGACSNGTEAGCYTCSDISEDSVCVQSCSASRLLNVDSRRCIKREECTRLKRKIYNKECLRQCPSNYTEQYNEATKETKCVLCTTKCPKVCDFSEIRSISQLEKAGFGCTIVKGSLEINIQDNLNNLTDALQKYLGDIEEITGNLKVYKSTPVTSLTFLNKLRRVHGMGHPNISFFSIEIYENWNLQSLFDWRQRNGMRLKLKTGTVLFQNNLHLCASEIKRFMSLIDMSEKQDDAFLRTNNGKLCTSDSIRTYNQVLSFDRCAISWDDSEADENSTQSYLLLYSALGDYETKEFDENMLYEREACSAYDWKNVIVNPSDITYMDKDGNMLRTYVLANLAQYTTYAFTIQPHYYYNYYNVSINVSLIDVSEISRFRTLMNVPSRVSKFSTLLKSSTSILLEWDVLAKEESAIRQFFIYIFENSPELDELDKRDYCQFPVIREEEEATRVMSLEEEVEKQPEEFAYSSTLTDENRCCAMCCEQKKEKERTKQYEMEDDTFRENLIEFAQGELRRDRDAHRDKMASRRGFVKKVRITENDQRILNVPNLKVFTFYSFLIYACTEDQKCSDYEINSDRTAMDESFDQINLSLSTNRFMRDTFCVHFDEPREKKNGAIIKYLVEIREKMGNETNLIKTECITRKRHEMNNYFYTANELMEGEYTFRVAAVSLAQQGAFTNWHFFKIIPHESKLPLGYFTLGIGIILALIGGASVSFYYKHKIITVLRPQNDTTYLMSEMEAVDEVAINHRIFEPLYDINEDDED